MATSTKTFLIELYQEYLEEASFLYEQRLGLLKDRQVTWRRIGEFEERFGAHIDGLVVGGDLALEVCTKQAFEGDFGELHAAVRVFCRQNRQDLVLRILREIDAEDPQKVQAVADALKHEFPEGWQSGFVSRLSDGEEKVTYVLAIVFGFRRFKSAAQFASRLFGSAPMFLPGIIQAVSRLGDHDAREPLRRLIVHEQGSICSAAALALLRLGEERTVEVCLQRARWQSWPRLPVALAGGRATAMEMLDLAKNGQVDHDGLIALGLLGSPSAVPLLIRDLDDPELARASATSLLAITGANLSENVFIPDKIEEDELFENERERFKLGQIPTRPDGKPYGTNFIRLSESRKDWEKWWGENVRRFNSDARYRYGKPYSPAVLLETLNRETSPHLLRQLAYEELVIRYGYDFAFETDMLVGEQESALATCAQWVAANEGRFKPGDWYFAGRLAA
jgi:uncharacterized protein (TIGR02270 family)